MCVPLHRLDIKHMKTVTYRPQANLTERVNRTSVQMIACFVEENHDNWDRFLHEFSFALRTAVNETTGKTPVGLFLGRKIITPFHKLVRVTDGEEYVGGNIEKLFDENKRTTGLEDLRFKRTRAGVSTGTVERYDRKRPKICKKRSLQGSEYKANKRKAPTLPGTSNQRQMRRFSAPKEESRRGARVQSCRARENRTTCSKEHSSAEGRPVRSRKTRKVSPCPYYLRSRLKKPESLPEGQRSTVIDILLQKSLRGSSLSMEALNEDPADRST
ncbi:uncharacterized protein TNCV_2223661 [Trichonephila clavipes]|nr:uncharacterized protein TNCV_2223661 [Trichonephila clavipes]